MRQINVCNYNFVRFTLHILVYDVIGLSDYAIWPTIRANWNHGKIDKQYAHRAHLCTTIDFDAIKNRERQRQKKNTSSIITDSNRLTNVRCYRNNNRGGENRMGARDESQITNK